MDMALCSVIMPAYNAQKFINKAIESVLFQTYQNVELIIVDDASTDTTREIVLKYAEKDNRVKPIFNIENRGCANSRNIALNASKGQYIAFIDSDDIWEGAKLEKEINLLNREKSDLVYSDFKMIDENGLFIKYRKVKRYTNINDLLKENYICFSSVVLKAELGKKVLMTEGFFHEDLCYLLDLLKNNVKFYGLNESLVQYRVSQQNRSSNKLQAAKNRWFIYRNYLNLSFFTSMKFFIYYTLNGIKKYYM